MQGRKRQWQDGGSASSAVALHAASPDSLARAGPGPGADPDKAHSPLLAGSTRRAVAEPDDRLRQCSDKDAGGSPVMEQGSARLAHTGTWLTASFHIITAVVGAGVLGLPNAMAWLGLAAGCVLLAAFYLSTLWTSFVLAGAKQAAGPHCTTYRKLVHELLGPRSSLALACCQYVNLVLVTIGYTVTAGANIRTMFAQTCQRPGCEPQLWQCVFLFGGLQLALSQLPSLESAWWSSLVGAAMSLLYTFIIMGLGLSQAGRRLHSAWGRPAPLLARLFGMFGAVGTLAFSFSFATVLVEIQATLSQPPPSSVSMKKATSVSITTSAALYACVAISCYMALGDAVPGDILEGFTQPRELVMLASGAVLVHMAMAYQVFAQPVFEFFESSSFSTLPSHPSTSARHPASLPVTVMARHIPSPGVAGTPASRLAPSLALTPTSSRLSLAAIAASPPVSRPPSEGGAGGIVEKAVLGARRVAGAGAGAGSKAGSPSKTPPRGGGPVKPDWYGGDSLYLRIPQRCLYVLLVTLAAAAVPHFHLIISLIGALTFWLPSIHLPVTIHLTTQPPPPLWHRAAAYTFDGAFLCATALAALASAYALWLALAQGATHTPRTAPQ